MTSNNSFSSLARGYKSLRVLVTLGEICFAGIAGGVMMWALTTPEQSEVAAEQSNSAEQPAYRANIVDRNGELLAASVGGEAAVYAIPSLVRGVTSQDTYTLLLQVFPELDPEKLAADLCSDNKRVLITRRVSPSKQKELFGLGLVGVEIEPELWRFYPQGVLTSHVVGYVRHSAQQGAGGIEYRWNQQIMSLREHDQSLRLTVDIRLQYIMWRKLRAQIERFKAIGGSGLILELPTREILAAVSQPDFDPHFPDPLHPANIDYNFAGIYESGSVFKIFNTAWAIENGGVQTDELIDTYTPIRGLDIEPPLPDTPQRMTIAEIFTLSSNLGSARIALRLDRKSQYQFMIRAGFGGPVRGVQARAFPQFPPWPDEWNLTERANISYGYRISVSPLHLAQATAAVVADGYVRPLVLIKNQHGPSTLHSRLVSAKTVTQMRSLMRLVVTEGTGYLAELEGYGVGGKTGTAEKVVDGQYRSDKVRTSFMGIFPVDDPQFLIFVLIDEPEMDNPDEATGGQIAAPVVKEVVKSMIDLLGIEPRYRD